jgi:predicted DNA-binding transcriptional regulator AlpA
MTIIETGKETIYNSLREAMAITGINEATISKYISTKTMRFGNKIKFEYI